MMNYLDDPNAEAVRRLLNARTARLSISDASVQLESAAPIGRIKHSDFLLVSNRRLASSSRTI